MKKQTILLEQDLLNEVQAMLDLPHAVEDAGRYEVLERFTADFGDGIEADINVCNSESSESGPFINAVLFDEGHEATCLDVRSVIQDTFAFYYGDEEYVVEIKAAQESTLAPTNHTR